jgi:hypothetical protein
VGDSDARPFIDIGVPTITIHSLTQATLRFLHTPADRINKIQWQDYFQTCRLVTAYLAFLDTDLETMPEAGAGEQSDKL